MSDPLGFPFVQACVTSGSISIDLIDVIGNAIDLAHRIVHRRARAIGLDRSRIGGLLRLCSSSLRVRSIFLRTQRLRLGPLNFGSGRPTSGGDNREHNREGGDAEACPPEAPGGQPHREELSLARHPTPPSLRIGTGTRRCLDHEGKTILPTLPIGRVSARAVRKCAAPAREII
jgi:hypothetical protein